MGMPPRIASAAPYLALGLMYRTEAESAAGDHERTCAPCFVMSHLPGPRHMQSHREIASGARGDSGHHRFSFLRLAGTQERDQRGLVETTPSDSTHRPTASGELSHQTALTSLRHLPRSLLLPELWPSRAFSGAPPILILSNCLITRLPIQPVQGVQEAS